MMGRIAKDWDWTVLSDDHKSARTTEHACLSVLMDIRDELKELNGRMQQVTMRVNCTETLQIPRLLRQIRANTTKRKRKVKP